MKKQDSVRYEMLARVQAFGDSHKETFPEGSVGGQAFAMVAAAVAELSRHDEAKVKATREGVRRKAATREALIERLELIGRTAQMIGETTPGFDDPFRGVPRKSDQARVTAGRVYAREAAKVKEELLKHGVPEHFMTELSELAESLNQAIRSRADGRRAQTRAQAGIDDALATGLTAGRSSSATSSTTTRSPWPSGTHSAAWSIRGPRGRRPLRRSPNSRRRPCRRLLPRPR